MIDKIKPNYLEHQSMNKEAELCEHIFEYVLFRLKQLKNSYGLTPQADKPRIIGAIDEINLLTNNFHKRYQEMKAREFKELEKAKKADSEEKAYHDAMWNDLLRQQDVLS